MNSDFKDKVIVVTGVLGRLGKILKDSFEREGAVVWGLDLEKNNESNYISVDIRQEKEVEEAFKYINSKGLGIDILVNNAGISIDANFLDRTSKDFQKVIDVNLKGTFSCIKSYVKSYDLREQELGSIVNIGSVFGVVSSDFRNYTDYTFMSPEVYGASKAGIIQMTKYFAVHLASRNIRVNCVSPGGIINRENLQGPDFIKKYSEKVPMGRMGELNEMIGAVLYFCGDMASYTTGQNLVIDGGLTSW